VRGFPGRSMRAEKAAGHPHEAVSLVRSRALPDPAIATFSGSGGQPRRERESVSGHWTAPGTLSGTLSRWTLTEACDGPQLRVKWGGLRGSNP
jgi:hypothetical protein